MMAYSVQETQRKLQTLGAVGIIAAAALSLVAVGPALAGGPPPSSLSLYNVTYALNNGSAEGSSGSADFFSTADAMVEVVQANLTLVIMHISYTDNSLSPLFNPAVTVTIAGPVDTQGTTGQLSASGPTDFMLAVPNEIPTNTTIQASSPEAAIDQATPDDANATIGMGQWTITFDVGSPPGGRIRPSGTITYTIVVDIQYFVAAASKA